MQLVSPYNFSPMAMGRTPPKGLVMVKWQVVSRICAIQHGMQPCAIWEQTWNNFGNSCTKSYGLKQSRKCSKTILKRPLADKCGMC
jgi:hypothetical protein